jgi:6-phosphogluconolactonase
VALLNVEANIEALAQGVSRRLADLVAAAQSRSGDARFCLTGGRTPRQVYARLGERRDDLTPIDWSRVELFWGDERHVPPDDADSNFGMARGPLLAAADVPPEHVHRIRGELSDAQDAAREYDEVIRRYERPPSRTFDVMLLGLGADAHIASLFPSSPILTSEAGSPASVRRPGPSGRGNAPASTPRAAAVWAPHLNAWRITLTPHAILDSDVIVVLTSGAEKANAVHAALRMPEDIERWPAQLLRAAGERVEWWMDRDAAARL